MVTYGDLFNFVIMICTVITLVLAVINAKNNAPVSAMMWDVIFCN